MIISPYFVVARSDLPASRMHVSVAISVSEKVRCYCTPWPDSSRVFNTLACTPIVTRVLEQALVPYARRDSIGADCFFLGEW
jgi:hypothetical protein